MSSTAPGVLGVSLFLAYSVLFYVVTASKSNKTNKKGSFLLSSNPTDTKVAAVIADVKRNNNKGGKNDEVVQSPA